MSDLQIRQLHQVMLPCADLERSIAFYCDVLGTGLIAEFAPSVAFFDLGGTRQLLERTDSPQPGKSSMYFTVPAIAPAGAMLRERGVSFDSELHLIHSDADGTFGAVGAQEWMAFFRDPDGNVLARAERRAS